MKFYEAIMHGINDASAVATMCGPAVNAMIDVYETYAIRLARVQEAIRQERVKHIFILADGLRAKRTDEDHLSPNMDSSDAADVIMCWLEEQTKLRQNSSAGVYRVIKSVCDSCRLIVTDSSALAMVKTLLSSDEPKGTQN